MAEGKLGSIRSTGSGNFTVYGPIPANQFGKIDINVVTESGDNTVKVYVSTTTTPTVSEIVQYDRLLAAKPGYHRSGLVLSTGEYVVVNTSAAGAVVRVQGKVKESPPAGYTSGKLANGNITTNTDTDVYTVPSSKTASANLSITTDGVASSGANVAVYIVDGVLATEDLVCREYISSSGKTGFELAGLLLSENEKIVIRTTNIGGSISYRLNGHYRPKE